jgi:hypothetical protein
MGGARIVECGAGAFFQFFDSTAGFVKLAFSFFKECFPILKSALPLKVCSWISYETIR